MGTFKNLEILAQQNADVIFDYHDWHFVEANDNRITMRNADGRLIGNTLRAGGDRDDVLNQFSYAYARSLNSGDEACDVIEKPHHYVEEIAAFMCSNMNVDDETLAVLGYWKCDTCDEQSATMSLTIDHDQSCVGNA
jgi:hypothetical protein